MTVRTAHGWLALLAPLLGVLYLVLCPPFLLDAERTQLATGHGLTRGAWSARVDAQGGYRLVPADYLSAAESYASLSSNAQARVDEAARFRELSAPPAAGPAQRMAVDPDARSPLPALPGAAGIVLGRLLDLSALAQLYLARTSALAVYVLAAVSAAALANPHGWLLFALALTPGVLLRAACNDSAMLADAQALLLLALALRLASGALDARRHARAVMLLAIGLALCQPAYIVLLPFAALLALQHLPLRARQSLTAIALLATCLAIALQWACDARPLVPSDDTLAERLTWPLREPWRALRSVRLTLFRRGDEAALELFVLPAALTQQLRFVGTFVATLHGQLLFALAAGALHAALPPERARALTRGALLAALLSIAAVGIQLLVAEPELRPPVLESFTGAPFFPACVALLLALASGARPIAARWLTRHPALTIVAPLFLLHAYYLAALTARFLLAPALPFPY